MPATIRLTVHPRVMRGIKRAAKAAFPKETYGLLLGTVVGDSVTIDDLYVPDDVAQYATENSVVPQDHWMLDAEELAKESDLTVVAWEHSHPYSLDYPGRHDRVQSEADIAVHPAGLLLSGICTVEEYMRKGKRSLRASVRFWAPIVNVETKIAVA